VPRSVVVRQRHRGRLDQFRHTLRAVRPEQMAGSVSACRSSYIPRVHRCPILILGICEAIGHLCALRKRPKRLGARPEPVALDLALPVRPCSRAIRFTSGAGTGPPANAAWRN
jgi:hypothetical protein